MWRIIIWLLFIPCAVQAQYFSWGNESVSTRWMQLTAPHITIIYDTGYVAGAQNMARLYEQAYPLHAPELGHHPRRMTMVLHTQTSTANGFVAWAPSRMELFMAPSPQNYAQPWDEQLVLHEFRHVLQLNKMEREMPRILYYLTGEHAAVLLTGLHLPFWYIEGDAVCSETSLSTTGRGRQPRFLYPFRAWLNDMPPRSYNQAAFGSYRHFTPDRYQLGYHLTAYLRQQQQGMVWDEVLHQVARQPLRPAAFSHAMKKTTGHTKDSLYCQATRALRHTTPPDTGNIITITPTPAREYIHYRFPHQLPDGRMVATESSLQRITRFILIDSTGHKRHLHTPGILNDGGTTLHNNMLCWAEHTPHIRWGAQSSANLLTLNMATGRVTRLTHGQQLQCPRYSPQGTTLAAIQRDAQGRYAIVTLDAQNGRIIKQHKMDHYPTWPVWNATGDTITYIAIATQGKALYQMDMHTGSTTRRSAFTPRDIQQPFRLGAAWYCVGGAGEADNICQLTSRGTWIPVTNTPYGYTDPEASPTAQHLVAAQYTAHGYRLVRIDPHTLHRRAVSPPANPFPLARAIAAQSSTNNPFGGDSTHTYPTQRYRRAAHWFRFHSWAPLAIDVAAETADAGITLLSQNTLSTTTLAAGYRYDMTEQTGGLFARYTYSALWPVISLSADHKQRAATNLQQRFTFYETQLKGHLALPLSTITRRWLVGLRPSLSATHHTITHTAGTPEGLFSGSFTTGTAQLMVWTIQRQSHRDFLPPLGLSLHGMLRQPLHGFSDGGTLHLAEARFWLPAMAPHHSINGYIGWQQKQHNSLFQDAIRYPRGMTTQPHRQMTSLALNYALPLACPDWSWGKVAYIKRIRLNLFIDHARWHNAIDRPHETSVGYDLRTDMHLFRLPVPMTLGWQMSWLTQNNSIAIQLLYSASLRSITKQFTP